METDVTSEALYRLNFYPNVKAPLSDELRSCMTWLEFVETLQEAGHYAVSYTHLTLPTILLV